MPVTHPVVKTTTKTAVRRGFTLIELLVVIAIIAILAAILFPVFAQAREKARQTSCLSNIKQIGTATMMYVQDYDETYPGGWGQSQPPDPAQDGILMWRIALQPYMKNTQIQKCPSVSLATWANSAYGYNAPEMTQWVDLGGGRGTSGGKAMASILSPAGLVAYCDAGGDIVTATKGADDQIGVPNTDCYDYSGNGGAACGPFKMRPAIWKEGEGGPDWDFNVTGRTGGWAQNGGRYPMHRHTSTFFNAAFADGHAKSVNVNVLNEKIGTGKDIFHNHGNN